ncbi:MAG: NUDIX domain-containing protein [Hyphomicrobiaceae bacterium]|nr:NUDIX domain-containing protein [Hyphomicrobiaceae bacterium]
MSMTFLVPTRRDNRHRVTLGAQAVVTDGQGQVLLVRHGYRPGWHFPGGGVERGESLKTAIARELDEETGIALEQEPRLFGIYAHFDAFPGDHIVLFTVERWRRVRFPAANSEIAEHGFFALNALPDETVQPTRRRLEEIFGKGPRAPHW